MSNYTDNEITVAEFGRRRGVTRQTAHNYKQDGRLMLTSDGKRVKYKESLVSLKKTAHMHGFANECHAAKERAEINLNNEKSFDDLKDDVNSTQLDLETQNAKDLFDNARALREKSAALQAAAEHEKFMGTLVSLEKIEKILFERSRQCRDGLMTSARSMAPIIAGKQDIAEIENFLTQEYRRLLENFAKLPII